MDSNSITILTQLDTLNVIQLFKQLIMFKKIGKLKNLKISHNY